MSTTASYQINANNRIIEVKISGEWHPAIDVEYMNALAESIHQTNHQKWAMLVDMSDCHIHANNISNSITDELNTNRRNQDAEVWVVNHADQGDFLLNFGSSLNVKVHKCFCPDEGKKYLQKKGFV